MPRELLQLTRLHDLATISVNPDHIVQVELAYESQVHTEVMKTTGPVRVVETPDEVAAKWKGAQYG